MRIKVITSRMGNDFHADMECEACGHEQKLDHGYDDDYYHSEVIPTQICEKCGLSRNYIINFKVPVRIPTDDELFHRQSQRQKWEAEFDEWCSTNVTLYRKPFLDNGGNVLFDIDGMRAAFFAGKAKS